MNQDEQCKALGRSLSLLGAMEVDQTMPRALRLEASQIAQSLKEESGSLDLKCSEAIYRLERFSRDPNIPAHSRAIIWQIVGDLSTLS